MVGGDTVSAGYEIDADFPGGNILVERCEGDEVSVRQDLRDTEGDWFYWCFRARGAAGRTLTVHFTGSEVVGVRGPGVSLDRGETWTWLGSESGDGHSFAYAVPAGADEVRFSFGMPYQQTRLQAFLTRHAGHAHLRLDELCRTRKGRGVECLHLGRVGNQAPLKVLLTCRHHCCEMMASYALEGLMEEILADGEVGQWSRDQVEFLVVPFADKDGVEDGDQGKNRRPRDHNRDYDGESAHVETASLRNMVPAWSEGQLRLALDLHCPWIRGAHNEVIYLVGSESPERWREQGRFSESLASVQRGPLVFSPADNLAFGQSWNTGKNTAAGMNFSRWASGLSGVRLATSIEIPYANASGREVNQQTAAAFGRDLARALQHYLNTAT